MQSPRFVSYALVLAIHQEQVETIGGTAGIRDKGLLESALSQPQATFAGAFLHSSIHEQAAAYLFHLAKNHPFIDGNKRTAFAVMLTFLELNGYDLSLTQDEAYALVLRVANSEISKENLAAFLALHLQPQ